MKNIYLFNDLEELTEGVADLDAMDLNQLREINRKIRRSRRRLNPVEIDSYLEEVKAKIDNLQI